MAGERRHRRAVGPAGATAPGEEPTIERALDPPPDPRDDDRLLRERPPHHEDRS